MLIAAAMQDVDDVAAAAKSVVTPVRFTELVETLQPFPGAVRVGAAMRFAPLGMEEVFIYTRWSVVVAIASPTFSLRLCRNRSGFFHFC